ncbi:MAG: protein translocase SEC61 complex subunit gamma [Candidatus Aenigmarchaeota archaeon]|nr:protein translocase SEC61 complex subunit gamma [Candidatus Aenigmarchaeota archaeon]
MQFRIRETLENYRRVLQIARKPDRNEFISTAKICGMGMMVVGLVGFALYLVSTVFIG